jgi:hypothetical protein
MPLFGVLFYKNMKLAVLGISPSGMNKNILKKLP